MYPNGSVLLLGMASDGRIGLRDESRHIGDRTETSF